MNEDEIKIGALLSKFLKTNNLEKGLEKVDANIVTLDLKSVRSSELSSKQKFSPNGFDGKEILTK